MDAEIKTSIIFTSYDLTQTLRQITMKSLESIFKYTDEEDYEIIWVDTIPKQTVGQVYLNPYYMEQYQFDKHPRRKRIIVNDDPGQYGCYNLGAREAKGKYLCFFQNDIFVPEGWLTDMQWYLDNLEDVNAVFPDQQPRSREYVKKSYGLSYLESFMGARDAGILFIRKSVFEKIGGWNEKVKVHYGEKDMYGRIGKSVTVCKPMIIHLEHAAGWERAIHESDEYKSDTTISAQLTK